MDLVTNTSSNNILLSNLIKIRWIAILGQLSAILIVYFYFEVKIPLFICILFVLISSLVNIYSLHLKKITNYLSDNETFFFLLFDTIQLAILLFLTGGIYNPFSLLLIAPIIISASYLRMVFSIILSLLSILIVAFISIFYIEIEWPSKFVIPNLFTYGLVLSLIISFIFITIYVYIFANSSRKISEALNRTSAALANQKKLSEVGSLSAAAVHELSTPLNTILLVLDDLKKDKAFEKNLEVMKEIDLLESQVQRCKQILLRLSKNPQKLKDEFFNQTTISNIIDTNFEKFKKSNIKMKINIITNESEPKIKFMDELMYGIGNIMQNAIQHCKKDIIVNISWNKDILNIFIIDDGSGFAREVLDQIGNPYISKNKDNGMGLGIFIAKNLIENIGGKIFFNNNMNNKSGSKVQIELNRQYLK